MLSSLLFIRWRKEKERRKEEKVITGFLLLWSLVETP